MISGRIIDCEQSVTRRAYVVTLPLRLVNTLNAREHSFHRARRAKEERALTRMAVVPRLAGARSDRWRVTMTRLYTRKAMDNDGNIASCKHVRDGIADALGIDDGSERIEWLCVQRRAFDYGVEILMVPQ